MSEIGEGRPISRRDVLRKGLGGAALIAGSLLGLKGVSAVTESQIDASTPKPEAGEKFLSKDTPIAELYVGKLTLDTATKTDPTTGKSDFLKLRVIPATTESKLIDNQQRVVEEVEIIPWEKINKLQDVDVKGQQLISLENVPIVHGQNVDPEHEHGDRWVVVDAVIDDKGGRDDKTKLFFNLSTQTSEYITAEPNPNAPTDGGFLPAKMVGDSLQILEQGAFWRSFGNEINSVSLPLEPNNSQE